MSDMEQLPLELALPEEAGEPFIDVLDDLVGRDRRVRERLLAVIQQWDHLFDELGRPATLEEYADRWNIPLSTAYRALSEFRSVFSSERDPTRLTQLLWDGLGKPYLSGDRLAPLVGVRVRLRGPRHSAAS